MSGVAPIAADDMLEEVAKRRLASGGDEAKGVRSGIRVALVCQANVNRSMEGHDVLLRAFALSLVNQWLFVARPTPSRSTETDLVPLLHSLKDKLQAESRYLQSEIKGEHDFEEIIGSSPALAAKTRCRPVKGRPRARCLCRRYRGCRSAASRRAGTGARRVLRRCTASLF